MKYPNEIVRYEISNDGIGLLAYLKNGTYWHIHSNELTQLEKWILKMLTKLKKENSHGKPK